MFFYSRLNHRRSRKRRSETQQKKLEGRFIITEVGLDGEPIAPEAAAKKFIRQSGCILRDYIPISFKLWNAYIQANGAGGSLRRTSRFQLNQKIYASAGP